MIDLTNINKIYIIPGSTDLRMGIDGYASIVQAKFNNSPFDGSLYIFCNKNHNKLKILHFEHDGLEPLVKLMHKDILKQDIIHADETVLQVIETCKLECRIWGLASNK